MNRINALKSCFPVAILLGLSISSCGINREKFVNTSQWLTWHPALEGTLQQKVDLEFEIKPLSTGSYELSGQTKLPEGSRLAVAAVRYLKLESSQFTPSQTNGFSEPDNIPFETSPEQDITALDGQEPASDNEISPQQSNSILRRLALDPSYVILDYQLTDVIDGNWRSALNLWEVARDGQYRESWQIHQEGLQLQWAPESDVIFLATLVVDGASDRLQPVQNKLADQNLVLSNTLVKTSLEGEQYFQAAQLLPIPLPTERTTPPGLRVQDINGGWGERYLLVEQDPLPGTYQHPPHRNTTAPGSPAEFIQ